MARRQQESDHPIQQKKRDFELNRINDPIAQMPGLPVTLGDQTLPSTASNYLRKRIELIQKFFEDWVATAIVS